MTTQTPTHEPMPESGRRRGPAEGAMPLRPELLQRLQRYAMETGLELGDALSLAIEDGLDVAEAGIDRRKDALEDIRDELRVIRTILDKVGFWATGAVKIAMHWRASFGGVTEEDLERVLPNACGQEWATALQRNRIDLHRVRRPVDLRGIKQSIQETLQLLHVIGPNAIGTIRFLAFSMAQPDLGRDGETLHSQVLHSASQEWAACLRDADLPAYAWPPSNNPTPSQPAGAHRQELP